MLTEERAYAKLNLTLGVLFKRADGYHALDSLMQTVSLYDSVSIENSRGVEVYVSGAKLPADNTMQRAAAEYKRITHCGCTVRCIKRIPQEAGLGGGSADAAAVLRGLQRLHRMLTERELMRLALSIGADVPFCLRGGTQRAEGVGEILTPFKSPVLHFVVAKPRRGVSTKELFSRLTLPRPKVYTMRAMAALGSGNIEALAPLMQNALQEPAEALVWEIAQLRAQLLRLGAIAACMTGSGSAVFGLFPDEQSAKRAAGEVSDAEFCEYCHSV